METGFVRWNKNFEKSFNRTSDKIEKNIFQKIFSKNEQNIFQKFLNINWDKNRKIFSERNFKPCFSKVLPYLFLLGMFFFWGKAAFSITVQTNSQINNSIEILLNGDTIGKEEETEILQTEKEQETPAEFILWGQEKEVTLDNEEYGRSSTAPALFLAGDSNRILDDRNGQLKGSQTTLKEEDSEGCLLGYSTAYELFGTENAVGNSFFYGKRKLTVRGVFSHIQKSIVLQAGTEEVKCFDHISLYIPKEESQSQYIDNFLLRNGLDGEVVGENFILALEKGLVFLLPCLFFILFLKTYCSFIKKYNRFPVLKGLLHLILIGVILFFFWIVGNKIQIPADMIPTKWSDFAFWQRYFETQKNSFYVFFVTEKTPFQIENLKRTGKIVGDMLIALFCLWKNVRLKSIKNFPKF